MKHAAALLALATLAGCASKQPASTEKKAEPKTEVAYFQVDPATAGRVAGKVSFQGRRPPRKALRIDEDPVCPTLNKGGLYDESLVVGNQGGLANVFVYVKQGLEGKRFPVPQEPVVIDQKGCRFGPRVLGVRVGQVIRVMNSDPVTHNIHPMPKNNREWNQSQEGGAPPLERKFVRPEVMIRVKCNVHSWMRAHVGALDHPYFAVTAAGGSFEIPNLPPGEYTLEAWHEKLGVQEQRVSVTPSGKSDMLFTFQGS